MRHRRIVEVMRFRSRLRPERLLVPGIAGKRAVAGNDGPYGRSVDIHGRHQLRERLPPLKHLAASRERAVHEDVLAAVLGGGSHIAEQNGVRTDFDELRRAVAHHGADRTFKEHRTADVAPPVVGVRRFAV